MASELVSLFDKSERLGPPAGGEIMARYFY